MLAAIDLFVLQALAASRIDIFTHFFILLSTIGETAVMIIVTIVVAAFLYWYRQKPVAYGLLITMATSTVITYLLKHFVARARPDVMYQAYLETGGSFPSGHSSAAAAFCGFFAYIAWTRMMPGPRRTLLVVVAVLYPLLMGFGRIYLGVHYLSDVLAGLIVGTFAAWVGTKVVSKLNSLRVSTAAPFAQ